MPPVVVAVAAAGLTAGAAAGVAGLGTLLIGSLTLGAALSSVVVIGGAIYAANKARQAASAAVQQQLRAGVISTAPFYRYAYGKCQLEGIRVFRYVSGNIRYDAYILNSRPSLGGFSFKLNDTSIDVANDVDNSLYDMDLGANVETAPWDGVVRLWASVGNHAKPPQQWLDEINDPDVFSASDIGLGMTMLWVRLDYGDSGQAQARWGGKVPSFKVDGYWSRVFDPRNPTHDIADPETHDWSATPALVALDLSLNRRALARSAESLNLDSFTEGASYEETIYTRVDGDQEGWFECHGIVQLQTREYDLLAPVLQAAASRLVKIGGIVNYVPGRVNHTGLAFGNPIGEQLEYDEEDPSGQVPEGVETRFISERRGWVETTLPILWASDVVSGGAATGRIEPLSFGMVSSATQAMRLQKAYLRGRLKPKRLTAQFGPEVEDWPAGTVGTVNPPEMPVIARDYEMQEATAVCTPLKSGGHAVHYDCVMLGQPADQFDFTQADEQVFDETYDDPPPPPVVHPATLFSVNRSGGNVVVNFTGSVSPSVDSYALRVREVGHEPVTLVTFDWSGTGQSYSTQWPVDPANDGQGRIYSLRAIAPFGTSTDDPEDTL